MRVRGRSAPRSLHVLAAEFAPDGGTRCSRLTAVPDEGGPLTTSTVKIIHTTPRDITHGRYDHTTRLGKLI